MAGNQGITVSRIRDSGFSFGGIRLASVCSILITFQYGSPGFIHWFMGLAGRAGSITGSVGLMIAAGA